MKVESAKSGFKPVTITLESQDELDLMCTLAYNLGGAATAEVFRTAGALHRALRDAGGLDDNSKFRVTASGESVHIEYKEKV